MESVYVWLLIFGGTGLLLLRGGLSPSDWKFQKQHRNVDERGRKHRFSETERSEIGSPVRSMPASMPALMPANQEVPEKIPSSSSELYEEEDAMMIEDTVIEELPSEQHQPAGDRDDNHEHEGKIANLLKQLHANERRLSESGRQIQRMGDRNSRLQTEVANLKHQLKASRITIQKFDAERQRLLRQLETTESMLATSQRTGGIDRDIKA
jgi:chromosome segregation ATPase